MGDHGAPMLEGAAQHHDQADQRDRQRQRPEIVPSEHFADQPAEQSQPGDAEADGGEANQHGSHDAQAYAFGERTQPRLDMHLSTLKTAL